MMHWENLAKDECPYCGGKLELRHDTNRWECLDCIFHIEPARKEKIVQHRGGTKPEEVLIRWQNLHRGLCPLCASALHEADPKYFIRRCGNSACPFKISAARIDAILSDPEHPANRFRGVLDPRELSDS